MFWVLSEGLSLLIPEAAVKPSLPVVVISPPVFAGVLLQLLESQL